LIKTDNAALQLKSILLIKSAKGLSIKDVRSQEGLPVRIFCGCGWRRVLQMRTSALFGAKNLDYYQNLWCARCGASANILRIRGEG